MEFVVPFAVELVSFYANRFHFLISYFLTGLTILFVQPAVDFKPFAGSRGTDEIHDHLV